VTTMATTTMNQRAGRRMSDSVADGGSPPGDRVPGSPCNSFVIVDGGRAR
jgi:hypothetical protein